MFIICKCITFVNMDYTKAYKGIAPNKIIAYSLKEKAMTQRELASLTGEHYQTINAIVNGKRDISLPLSTRLDKALGFEEGFFAIVQTYYQLKSLCNNNAFPTEKPIPSIRPVVFWDIDMSLLDWGKDKKFIVERVNERGNKKEIESVNEYYDL